MRQIRPPTPRRSLAQPQSDRDYLLLHTHLPMRRLSKLPLFLRYVRKIQQQLDAAPDGLVGYSLLAKTLSSNYWTLSARRDSDAIAGFMHVGAAVASVMSPRMRPSCSRAARQTVRVESFGGLVAV